MERRNYGNDELQADVRRRLVELVDKMAKAQAAVDEIREEIAVSCRAGRTVRITIEEMAGILGVNRGTVSEYIKYGKTRKR